MPTRQVFLLSFVVALVASAATTVIVNTKLSDARARSSDGDTRHERYESRIQDLEDARSSTLARLDEIASRLRELKTARLAPVESDAPMTAGALSDDAAAARSAPAKGQSRPVPGDTKLTVESAIARLRDPELSDTGWDRLWKTIREAGLMEEVIAELEKQAKATPGDADVQTQLGGAYLAKIQEVGNGPEAGEWATKADKAFDAALEIDPEHWDARFSKAIALSFWPPVFGKQREAINHFETLAAQQDKKTPQPEFASTYLLLGNMYQQIGDPTKAMASWQRGLKMFPDNDDLKQQIANANH